jgi:hypothetical protein
MFDRRSDDARARSGSLHYSEYCKVIRLGSAGSKDDFGTLRAEYPGNAIPRVVERGARETPLEM